jgi:hypothetical protein
MAMATRLRAQILFRSFHGRTKMRSRMARPARIVEYGARESDKIGIASSNDRLSLIIASDKAHRDGRQVRCGLDDTGEWHLIACAGVMPPLETWGKVHERADGSL